MFELIKSGGWLMLPIILSSVIAMAIIGERLWTLRKNKIMPLELVPQVWKLAKSQQLDKSIIRRLKVSSPLGAILAAGLMNSRHGRQIMN